jgi:hypothetical protein
MKVPVIQSNDYIVYVETVDSHWFIHMDVFKWTKQIKVKFLSEWNTWVDTHKDKDLFAMPFIDDSKMAKWIQMTGFKLLEHHVCTDGVTRKLYKWGK